MDEAATAGSSRRLLGLTLTLLAAAVAESLADWGRLRVMARVGQETVLELRLRILDHLVRLPHAFFDRVRTGDLVSRVVGDVDAVASLYTRAAALTAGNLVILTASLLLSASWSAQLGLIYLLTLPFLLHYVVVFARRVRPALTRSRLLEGDLTARIRDALEGQAFLAGLAGIDATVGRLETASDDVRRARGSTAATVAFWRGYPVFLLAAAAALVVLVGGNAVRSGSMTVGTLAGALALYGILLRPLRQTGFMYSLVLRATASGERIFEILDVALPVPERPDPVRLPAPEGRLCFEGVSFAYPEGPMVLRDIDLTVEPGELVALVGSSGAGKSTLVHLLPRFHDPTAGRILLDGINVADLSLADLRATVGVAFQTSFILDATFRENLTWGRPGASEAELWEALATAALDDLVRGLPDGLDTPLGHRGLRLSGGERQRLALARVLLYDPRVLLLDEPTASLDPATESALGRALALSRRGRTTIVVAHRLWTVRSADRIVVLEGGRVADHAESTPTVTAHDQLVERGGPYAALWAVRTGERS